MLPVGEYLSLIKLRLNSPKKSPPNIPYAHLQIE